MKTSPELLTDILGVLGHISAKLDSQKQPKSETAIITGGGIFGLFNKKGVAAQAAEDIEKLKTAIKGFQLARFIEMNKELEKYSKLSNHPSKHASGWANAAKDVGQALLYMAGGIAAFALTMSISSKLLGISPIEILEFVVGTAFALSLSMIIIAGGEFVGDKLTGKSEKGKGKSAIGEAKDMGIALMYIAGGILSFAISLRLVPIILKKSSILAGVGEIALIIAGMVGIFFLLGLAKTPIEAGTGVAMAMGIGIGIISLAIIAVALTSKLLLSMFKDKDTNKEGHKKSKLGGILGTLGNAVAALGMFGLFIAGLAATFWVMGLPIVSGPILLGSLALLGMAVSLIATTKAIKSVNDIMKSMDMKKTTENIKLMVSGVMSGVIQGVMGSGLHKNELGEPSSTGDLTLKEVRQFRRIKRVIRMLGSISSSLSEFAMGLRAFAKLGEISSLEYDENGKPIIGKKGKIHVTEIAKSIADTFGIFIKSLVENTQNLTRHQARSLKILGKALTGDQGLIHGVVEFATALKTFSEFGAAGEIYVPAIKDDDGKIVKAAEHVKITTITQNIVDTFGKFVTAMAEKAPLFEAAGPVGNKMQDFNEALMGVKRSGIGSWFRRDKPGILSALTGFNDLLLTYSNYGKDGAIPVKDKDGNIIPGKFIKVEEVANNMVTGVTTFVSSLNKALEGKNLKTISGNISDQLGSFGDIINQLDTLAKSQEGIDKLANSMGLLATNIGLLVTNMSSLNTDKLAKLATITAQHAVVTKGVTIPPVGTTTTSSSTTSSSPAMDWDRIGEIIGQKVAERINATQNGEYKFTFYNETQGNLEFKKH